MKRRGPGACRAHAAWVRVRITVRARVWARARVRVTVRVSPPTLVSDLDRPGSWPRVTISAA